MEALHHRIASLEQEKARLTETNKTLETENQRLLEEIHKLKQANEQKLAEQLQTNEQKLAEQLQKFAQVKHENSALWADNKHLRGSIKLALLSGSLATGGAAWLGVSVARAKARKSATKNSQVNMNR